jgi:DNA-binding transcriptional LysR family regulator
MDRLDLRLVEYFVAVAEELHFGRAAERLHIAQPSLSQQIRKLEQQLGVVLLRRTSRRVSLTPAGKAFLREGRRTLRQAQRTVEAARVAGRRRITVGFYGSAGGTLLTDVLTAFADQHPSIDVSVRELLFGSLDDVLNGNVDVAFTRLLPGQTEAHVEVLAHEDRVLAVPAAHLLAGRPGVAFADLRGERFIINPAAETDAPPARWLAEQRRHDLPGTVAEHATSVQEILTLVAAGRGVCIVPASVARRSGNAEVSFVPVRDAEPAVVSLAWRPDTSDRAVQAFIEATRAMVAGATASER